MRGNLPTYLEKYFEILLSVMGLVQKGKGGKAPALAKQDP